MPTVPFGLVSSQRQTLPPAYMTNMVLEKDESGMSPDGWIRMQRPGLSLIDSSFTPYVRGLHYYTAVDQNMTVYGDTLSADSVEHGPIDGDGIVEITDTAFTAAILGGTTVYLYDGTTLTTLSMPDGRDVQSIDQLNGYILLLCPDGRFYWLEPGSTTVDPLNFATAESLPDEGTAICRIGDEFIILGTQSGEFWQATGNVDAPFQRVSGRPIERGCIFKNTVQRFDNSVVWVGEDLNVYRLTPQATVIGTPDISEHIRFRTDDCSAWTFGADQHKYYVLRVPGVATYVFDASTSRWQRFASAGLNDWLPHVGYDVEGITTCGSYADGRIWSIDPRAKNDGGDIFPRVLTGTVAIQGKTPRNDSFSVGINADIDFFAKLRWKDGQDDYPAYYDQLEVRAPHDVATMYRLGMPDQPYRTFELTVDADVMVSVTGAYANEGWK